MLDYAAHCCTLLFACTFQLVFNNEIVLNQLESHRFKQVAIDIFREGQAGTYSAYGLWPSMAAYGLSGPPMDD